MLRPFKIPSVLKTVIAAAICNPVVGNLLSLVYHDRIPHEGLVIDTSHPIVTPTMKASIFWRLYEGAEIRFVHQYLRCDLDVVELGSSIGVLACQVRKQMVTSRRLFCVEADPRLVEQIHTNLSLNKLEANVLVINHAIAYGIGAEELVSFSAGEANTLGQLTTGNGSGSDIKVRATTLSGLLEKNGIGEYSLICDIEGAEADIPLHDAVALEGCKQLIIELHKTVLGNRVFEVENLIELFSNVGRFNLRARYGPVCVFERRN